jgi:hypothetical protein
MEIEDGVLYSLDEIKNIYQQTTGHEMNQILDTKYFEGYPNNKTLKDFYKFNQEDIKRLNRNVSSLVN